MVVDPDQPATLADRREAARAHGVEVLAGRVVDLTPLDDGRTRVDLVGGHAILARWVLAAEAAEDDDAVAVVLAALADEDAARGAVATNALDWDHRYGGEQMWSGNPNGTLVAEATGLAPGRALDVGAGEGGDAIWLAEQGWTVTANDISARALERLAAEADRRGLRVRTLCADANTRGVFGDETYDLVSAQYASIPRTGDGRGLANLLGAVAPGGTIVVVSHDLDPMRAPVDTSTTSRPWDPDAYVRVTDVAEAIADDPDWVVEVHELRPRPPGSATAAHHVDDLVLRARRTP